MGTVTHGADNFLHISWLHHISQRPGFSPQSAPLFLSALTNFFSNQPSHFFLDSLNQRTSRRSLVLASTPLFPLCMLVQCLSFYQKVEFYTVTHWFLFWKKRIKCLAVMGTSGNWKKALIGLKKPEKDDRSCNLHVHLFFPIHLVSRMNTPPCELGSFFFLA